MKRLKSNYLVILLFLLLCIVALMPIFLTEIQNQRLIGKATVEKVNEDTIIGQRKKVNTDVSNRLKTIIKAETEPTGIITEQMKLEIDPLDLAKIVETLEEQIYLMQETKALPLFEMGDDYSLLFFAKRTLMDSKDPTLYVSLWNLELSYDDYNIKVYLDTETDVVYQLYMSGKMEEFQMDVSEVKFVNFLKYLNIDEKQVAWTVGENKWESKYYEGKGSPAAINYFCYIEAGYIDYSIMFQP